VFGYLGDARWASIYAVAAGATVVWTSTWWGTGLPWHGGVAPGSVPDGAVAGLGLVTWAVLGSWLVIGWRTVAVEAGPVDNRGDLTARPATLPTGEPDARPRDTGMPGDAAMPGDAGMAGNGLAPAGEGTSPSRGSLSLPT
jgi:hypothetical protein